MVQKLLDRAPTTCTTQRCHIRYSSYFFRCSSRINAWTPSQYLDPFRTPWVLSWRLKFNAQKCKVLSVTRKHHPIVAEYTINSEIMQHVDTQRDLGVTFSSHTRHAQTMNGKTLEREHQALSIFNTCKIPSGICLTGLESTKYDHVHGT